MTRLTPAPTMPTSSEICAPNNMREKTSRPWTSVPNQYCIPGGAKAASESWLGLWTCAKVPPDILRIAGHAMMASNRKTRYHALMTAARFRRKRCHARWPGVRLPSTPRRAEAERRQLNFELSTFFSLIFHARVEQGVGEIHHQVQHDEQKRIEQSQIHCHEKTGIQTAVDEKNADAGNLENILDDERTGQQIGQHGAGIGNDRQDGDADGVFKQQQIFAESFRACGADEFGLHRTQHSFAEKARDFSGKIQTKRDE